MSDITYINKNLLMEGSLESKDGQVVIAGNFKGNIVARSVIIETTALFNGNINAEHLKVDGLMGILLPIFLKFLIVVANEKLKTNSLSVDTGAQISNNVGRILDNSNSL